MHVTGVMVLIVALVWVVLIVVVCTRHHACHDFYLDAVEMVTDYSPRWLRCAKPRGSPRQLAIVLVQRVAAIVLMLSGVVAASANGHWDYPNSFVGFPLGVFLLLLSFDERSAQRSGGQRCAVRLVHFVTAAFTAWVQLEHLFFIPEMDRCADSTEPQPVCMVNLLHLAVAALVGAACLASTFSACTPPVDPLAAAWRLARGAHGVIAANILLARLFSLAFFTDDPTLSSTQFSRRTTFGFAVVPSPLGFELHLVATSLIWLAAVAATKPAAREWLAGRCAGVRVRANTEEVESGLSLTSSTYANSHRSSDASELHSPGRGPLAARDAMKGEEEEHEHMAPTPGGGDDRDEGPEA